MENTDAAPDLSEEPLHLRGLVEGGAPADPDGATMVIRRSALEESRRESPILVSPGEALGADELLGAVAYCYAKGVHGSEEIHLRMAEDPEFRDAIGHNIPDAPAIMRFRKLNAGAIQRVLEEFYAGLVRRTGAGSPDAAGIAEDRENLENTAHFVRRLASDQIELAKLSDRMSGD